MTKKIAIYLSLIFIILAGLWIWTLVVPNRSYIMGGSTSVNPLMQKVTTTYYNNEKKDFIYNSTGSQAGVVGVQNGSYEVGFISKDATESTLTTGTWSQQATTSNDKEVVGLLSSPTQLKDTVALEFAVDAIVIIYHPPSSWDPILSKNLNFIFADKTNLESKQMLQKIYDFQSTWNELARFVQKNSREVISDEIVNKVANEKILPITREDGSGTRDAFSSLTGVKNMPAANVVNSNGMMLQMVESGGFGYISYAFVPKITKSSGMYLSAIDGIRLANPVDYDGIQDWEKESIISLNEPLENSITNEEAIMQGIYKFQRPFIAIFNSFNQKIDAISKFLIWIIEESQNGLISDIYRDEGLIRKVVLNPQNKVG
ncbi:phosphate ABC transporter substrate-binding protein [Spiroplasma sabaudiense Ar-1343]|uniref:Phosphate ABC transporter substrate-binding protein n=1 Tax=Spiroplasma sabaudiense Ar-1343 TaxID=1276257 RepID=W6AAG7_9MOLU|nr:phosphate ABC transporter substrate-binding protein [Spiroplasma sabaudiense]AHI54052.1 phosphate ABC transporter substrate-binding protein [Spiroplasma sabaudiense Ar-1343]